MLRIKEEYEKKIRDIETQIKEAETMTDTIAEQLDFCGQMLPNLAKYYDTADLQAKRQIIGSIFSEKLIFDGKECRTKSYNSVISWIVTADKGFSEILNEKSPGNSGDSSIVPRTGILLSWKLIIYL